MEIKTIKIVLNKKKKSATKNMNYKYKILIMYKK